MSPHDVKSVFEVMDKVWHKSKKFLAFLIMELYLFTIAAYILYVTRTLDWAHAAVLLGIVFSMAALALAFNSSQTKLDSYIRGMALLSGGIEQELKQKFFKDIGLQAKKETDTKE